MKNVELAMTVIEQGETYHFQLRDHKHSTGASGFIGCYGGRIEEGETAIQAAAREVCEETELTATEHELSYMGEVRVTSDMHGKPAKIHAHIFRLLLPEDQVMVSLEGTLVSMTHAEALADKHKLTPATRKCFETLIQKG